MIRFTYTTCDYFLLTFFKDFVFLGSGLAFIDGFFFVCNAFLDSLRLEFPDLIIQAISSDFILSVEHARKILSLSILAKKRKLLLSKKLETDILLRFAGTTQINYAIKNLGLSTNQDFLLICIGKTYSLNKLYKKLIPNLMHSNYVKHSKRLENYFKITKKNLNAINSKTPLEDLLVEKASILV